MIAAIDCDLHKLYCVGEDGTIFANGVAGAWDLFTGLFYSQVTTLLFEIAGPVDYTDSKAAAHNKRRWTIFNVAQAALLQERARCPVLVAPSSVWTKGYQVKQRHKLAGATAKNKDLRECQSMIVSHKKWGTKWIPFPDFIANL